MSTTRPFQVVEESAGQTLTMVTTLLRFTAIVCARPFAWLCHSVVLEFHSGKIIRYESEHEPWRGVDFSYSHSAAKSSVSNHLWSWTDTRCTWCRYFCTSLAFQQTTCSTCLLITNKLCKTRLTFCKRSTLRYIRVDYVTGR